MLSVLQEIDKSVMGKDRGGETSKEIFQLFR